MTEQIVWSPGVTLEDIERQVILKALAWFKNNKTQTSIALGVSVKTIDTKLKKYGDDEKSQQMKLEKEAEERKIQLARARGIVTTANGEIIPGSYSGVQPLPRSQKL